MRNDLSSALSAPTYVRLREKLRADIATGTWGLGQHVTLAEFTGHYGVGMNPVREALLQLQGEGLIEMRMHRGAVIRSVDAAFIRNVYDVRGAIEGMLAAASAQACTGSDLEHIEAAATSYEAAAASGDVAEAVAANRTLHRAINEPAGNPPAIEILEGRSVLIDALRRTLGYQPYRLQEVVKQHRVIVEALRDRDAKRAADAAQRHTRDARDDLLTRLEEHTKARVAKTPR